MKGLQRQKNLFQKLRLLFIKKMFKNVLFHLAHVQDARRT